MNKPKEYYDDLQPLLRRNRIFIAGTPYISKDIKPEEMGDFVIANKPADIHAMGIFTKQISYKDIVKKCIN